MMSEIYYGKVKKDKVVTWNENNNPYDILEERLSVNKLGGWDFLEKTNEIFSDKHQVDWGSFAYRCTKEQLLLLKEQTNCEIENIDMWDAEAEYAIVFIELY